MGYCVEISETTFSFDKSNSNGILDKVKKDFKDYDNKELRWVDKSDIFQAETIEELFNAFRLELTFKEDEDIYEIDYMSGEKLGGYELDFYKCIAKFINDSYIEYLGEDGEKWRYVFKDGKCEEKYPAEVWK